ncbi:MAG: DEAD/DEAH box helicase [Blastocatellia bacterium]
MDLREYQKSTHDAIFAALGRGVKRQLVVWPTGAGKTVLFTHVIKSRGGRALILAHRDELLSQAADKVLKVIPGAHLGIVRAGLDQRHAQIVIASVQTLARERRLQRLAQDFDTLVIDEAHHAEAASYRKIVDYFAVSNPLILGVTATPDRGDGKGLDGIFEEIVAELSIEDGIQEGWLCDIEGKLIKVAGLDLTKVHTKAGDLDGKELEAIMKASNWHEHVAKAFFEHAQDRRTVVFVPKVQMAHDLAQHLAGRGVRAAAIDGSSDVAKRRLALVGLSNGDLQVIINCAVLTEGFDEPSLSCVMMCRPTKSRALYTQCIGRGLRPHPGKQNCLVLDLVGNSQRHDLVNIATLAGVQSLVDGEGFRQAKLRATSEARENERQKQAEEDRERLEAELAALRVDILRKNGHSQSYRNHSHKRGALHWQLGLDRQRSLTLSDRVVVVRPMADESWLATDHRGWRFIGASEAEAMSTAEGHAKQMQFRDPNAAWRTKPASDKQLRRLQQWRIPHDPMRITAGQASDLIGAWIERRKGKVT